MEFTQKEVDFLEKVIFFKVSESKHRQDFLANTRIADGKDGLSPMLYDLLDDKFQKEENQLKRLMIVVTAQNEGKITSIEDINKIVSKNSWFNSVSTLVKSTEGYLNLAEKCEQEVIRYIADSGIKLTEKPLSEMSGLIFEEKRTAELFTRKLVQVLKQFDVPLEPIKTKEHKLK